MLGNLLQLCGFDYETPEPVRAEIFPTDRDITSHLNNSLENLAVGEPALASSGLQRIGEVPIYQADPIVRRAESLQRTHDAAAPSAWMSGILLDKLGVTAGDTVRVKQGDGEVQITAARDDKLPNNCVRVASAHPLTAALGGMFGEIMVERL